MSSRSGEVIKPTLLIVEDDEAIQHVLEHLFHDEGYVVHVAAELATARRVLADQRVDVVILDMRLAGGDYGGDLVVDLAARSEAPAVVILSASPELAVPLANHYGITWVPKPFELEMVTRVASVAREMSMRPRRPSGEHSRVTDLSVARRARS